MTREEIEELKGLAASMGLYDDKNPCKRAVILGKAIKALEQEPTTKNDLAQERYQDLIEYFGDEKVAKTIVESRKEFKAWLERIKWHVKRTDELARELEQIKSTTKNDLGVDCISRDEVCRYVSEFVNHEFSTREEEELIDNIITGIEHMPSVTPQESFINKPCVSGGVCEHDKQKVLNKIRAEIESYKLSEDELSDMDEDSVKWGMKIAYDIIEKHKR